MNSTMKHWMKVGLAAGLCLFLYGCGKSEAPEAYVIGENSAIPLDSCLTEEEGGAFVSVSPTQEEVEKAKKAREKAEKQAAKEKEKAEKKAQKEKEKAEKEKEKEEKKKDKHKEQDAEELSEEVSAGDGGEASEGDGDGEAPKEETIVEPSEEYTYTYEAVPAAAMERYAEAITAEDQGFTAVDMERVPLAELPALDTEEGSVIYAKNGAEENTLFIINIEWAEGVHTITVRCPEGQMKDGVSAGEEAEEAQEVMTLVEMMDYVRTLKPSALGLEGESMSEYHLIPVQGSPLVDGEVCRHVNIYREDASTGTNTFISAYLVGINKVYRLDEVERTVERVL